MQPAVQNALNNAPAAVRARPQHGKCCEIDALNRAIGQGQNVRGGTSAAVNATTEAVKPPCVSCQGVLRELGVTAVKP